MSLSRLGRGELVAVAGGVLLALSLVLAWYATDAGNRNAEIDGARGSVTGWASHPILHWPLLATAIANARAALEVGDLAELIWSFAPPPRPRPRSPAELPSVSDESRALARELKRRGFKFVGPTTVYALMQACGLVDDHLEGCVA